MTAPQRTPGRRVRGSTTGRPVMALLDLLGRRWSLRIVWELREATLTSRALRAACDHASPTVLQQRLSELRAAGLVEAPGRSGYQLTPLGRQLIEAFAPLYLFADHWADAQAGDPSAPRPPED